MKTRAQEIQKAIYEIKPPLPSDGLIGSYKDFLKHEYLLPYMQFNEKVAMSLMTLALHKWDSEKRVNRMLLLDTIKRYFKKRKPKHAISPECLDCMTELFKKVMLYVSPHLMENSVEELKQKANSILIGVAFPEKHLPWFFENAAKSEYILTRLLRYPKKSKLISGWAKQNFEADAFCHRRAEMLGWVLDENKRYLVSKQTLTDDFKFMNSKDMAAVNFYKKN